MTEEARVQDRRRLALTLLAVAQFVVVLDAAIVNVALPEMGRELRVDSEDLSWVVNAYTLVLGGFLLLGGRMADLLGRRRLFVVGLVIFALASLAGGPAQNLGQVVGRRRGRAAGRRADRPARLGVGAPRGAVTVTAGLSLLVFTLVDARSAGWGSTQTIGLGALSLLLLVTIAAVSGLRGDEAGLVSGLINTSQQIGGALGLAVLATIADNRIADLAGPQGPSPEALAEGFQAAFLVGAAFALVGALVAATLIASRDARDHRDAARAGEVRPAPGVA